jgi:hypothetical protein
VILKRVRHGEIIERGIRDREGIELDQRLFEPAIIPHDEDDEEGKIVYSLLPR